MGSRLLPVSLVLAAVLADSTGLHGAAFYFGLLAVPGAAAVAFVAISEVLESRAGLLSALSSGLALTLLVAGSAIRENAPRGAALPPIVLYALLGAATAYALPAVAWVLEPVRIRPRRGEAPMRTRPRLEL